MKTDALRRFQDGERVESSARKRLGLPVRAYDLGLDEAEERADAERLRPALGVALDELPPAQRRAVELRVVEELDYGEVAASLGCSAVAARLRVMRALGSLSRLLKGASP